MYVVADSSDVAKLKIVAKNNAYIGSKLQNAVLLYDKLVEWYEEYLKTDEAHENINVFDQLLPDYAWISDTKKIDCLLWSIRR